MQSQSVEDLQSKMRRLVQQAYELGLEHGKHSGEQGALETTAVLRPKPVEDDGFAEIWQIYNHKVGKQQAQRKWRRMPKRDRNAAMAAVKKYVDRTDPDGKDGKRYRAHLSTWLNQRRWEDEIAATTSTPTNDGLITLE